MTKREYYRRLWAIFRSYRKRETVLPYLPIRLWIEPTSFCNLKCVMCPNKDLDRRDKGYMPLELFRKIVDEAAGFIHEANLIHRGESLLHPDFFEMVRYAGRGGDRDQAPHERHPARRGQGPAAHRIRAPTS